uniref:Cytochrome c oxidase subunit 7C, mitochondrial n=1 Tax=Aotus nancymaae TaxID=37293 RepID=A0A2K5D269_AOTNA
MLGQSTQRFTTSVIHRCHYEEVENKWRLLATVCLYFGSAFAAPFFIVRHQLLKK